jgi:DNA-binding NtrC family response regulator
MSRDSALPAIVLIAEDDDVLRARMSRALRLHGFGVLEAKTSIEALLMAVAFEGDIEALITSVELRTYSNGPELAHCIRVSRPEMRVIYLSEAYPCEDVARDTLLGAATVIAPPATAAELKSLITEISFPQGFTVAKSLLYQRS